MLVLYDDNCPLCKSLALFLQKKKSNLEFHPWEEFRRKSPEEFLDAGKISEDKLKIWDGKTLYEGPEAWSLLLRNHPDLKSFNWLAEKLHLQEKLGQSLDWLGTRARKICLRCSKRRFS